MTHFDFKKSWTNIEEPLSPLTEARIGRFNLLPSTADFLTQAGLPVFCDPNLHFANDTDDIVYGINKLTDQYDFEDDRGKFEKYIVIGSCLDGDAIAIDIFDSDKIVELDHEDSFSPMYFNSSIATLADFLIIFRDFRQAVSVDKEPGDDFQCYNFTNQQFYQLQSEMFAADKKAITETGFWKEELDLMLSIRLEMFGSVYRTTDDMSTGK